MPAFFLSIQRLFRNRRGQGMVEYGLIIGLVAVAVIAVLTTMGGQITRLFQQIVTALTGAGTP
jgi:pilus assembly protein Flp/PilA